MSRTSMLKPAPAKQLRNPNGIAKRLRGHLRNVPTGTSIAPNSVVMLTVSCDECGAQFALLHPLAAQDFGLAEKQAVWLKEHFVWEHLQENKHAGSVCLPSELSNTQKHPRERA